MHYPMGFGWEIVRDCLTDIDKIFGFDTLTKIIFGKNKKMT